MSENFHALGGELGGRPEQPALARLLMLPLVLALRATRTVRVS